MRFPFTPHPAYRLMATAIAMSVVLVTGNAATTKETGSVGPHIATPAMLPDSIGPGERDYLEPNVPNPVRQGTVMTIGYSIRQETHVVMKLYDSFYQEIMVIVDEAKRPGYQKALFSLPSSIPSGVYFYELRAGDYYEIRRLIYVR